MSPQFDSVAGLELPTRPSPFRAASQPPSSDQSLPPIPTSRARFARQNRCDPPPDFPLASPSSGIVHHLSGRNALALPQGLPKTSGSGVGAPVRGIDFHFHCALGFSTQTLESL